jgi:hypothetical protein
MEGSMVAFINRLRQDIDSIMERDGIVTLTF